jgi:polysaccharide export outer membrane protein
MRSFVRTISAALVLLVLGACSHAPKKLPREPQAQEYLIGFEDVLDVSVWRDADLSRTVPVRPDGRVSMPLIGEIRVAGRSAKQVATEIRERLLPYIQDPRVVVIVREVNSPRVYVIGEVARPGAFPLRGRLTVLQALSLAGGLSEFADTSGIVVLHGERRERFELDYTDLVSNQEEGDFVLGPGDTIYVP